MSNLTRTFLIGASVSIFPIVYLGIAHNKLSNDESSNMKIKYATLVMCLPIVYGFVYTILMSVLEDVVKDDRTRLIIIGLISGGLYSIIGRFYLRIPETLLLLDYPHRVHIIAPIIYAIIYATYGFFLEKNIIHV